MPDVQFQSGNVIRARDLNTSFDELQERVEVLEKQYLRVVRDYEYLSDEHSRLVQINEQLRDLFAENLG